MDNDYQDKLLNCRECSSDFIFSIREQEFYAQKGFDHEPTRCLQCRNQRRRDRTVTPTAASAFNTPRSYPQPQFSPTHNAGPANYQSGNNGNSRPSSPTRNNSLNNGYRPNAYSNRQFGPNYSTLGRNSTSGYNTRPTPYNSNSNNGYYYGNPYNRNGNAPVSNGFNNPGVNLAERKMYPIVCARCSVSTEVPFPPREGTPVFCRTCYNSQKNSR